jgi:7-carboxy-7-deazaguanine synthase
VKAVKDVIRISEIFGPTIQGEGPLIGRPTVFVRTGGCDYRCRWCDTLYAVLPRYRKEWPAMSSHDIFARIEELSGGKPLLVTLSGGNPALQPLGRLIELGHAKGYRFAAETQGSVDAEWFGALDWLVLSPKPPSSAMATDWIAMDACLGVAGAKPRCVLKVVIFDDVDYGFAREAAERYPELPIYLQVGNPAPMNSTRNHDAPVDEEDLRRRLQWLIGKVAEDRWFAATVLPQLHVLIWGNKRGV